MSNHTYDSLKKSLEYFEKNPSEANFEYLIKRKIFGKSNKRSLTNYQIKKYVKKWDKKHNLKLIRIA